MGFHVLNLIITLLHCDSPLSFPNFSYFCIYEDHLHGHSQDLNQPLQDIAQNFDDDLIIITLTTLS